MKNAQTLEETNELAAMNEALVAELESLTQTEVFEVNYLQRDTYPYNIYIVSPDCLGKPKECLCQ
jgi:hypothetical protein